MNIQLSLTFMNNCIIILEKHMRTCNRKATISSCFKTEIWWYRWSAQRSESYQTIIL